MLSVVLDGIARFARLINADFGDLLEVLREILEGWDDDDGNRTRAQLVCINTVAKIRVSYLNIIIFQPRNHLYGKPVPFHSTQPNANSPYQNDSKKED
jgi:hypothetical protein